MIRSLADAVLDDIVAAIVPRFAPASILLFGSRARGDHRQDSDYDIMVVMDHEEPSAEAAIRRLVARPGRPVDVLVTSAHDFERRRTDVGTLEFAADQEGRVLYERRPRRELPRQQVRERPVVPESFAEWVERAERDYLAMSGLADDARVTDAAAFHAHQCVEKYIKATLVRRRVQPRRTHVLTELLDSADPVIRGNERVREACSYLDGLWPYMRYPTHRPPTAHEVQRAVSAADDVRGALGFPKP